MISNLLDGLSAVLTLGAFPYLILGMCTGMFIAMLPGLGVGIALSLMLPFLYHMNVTAAILLMLGTLAGEYFSASITAILLNTPGAPESYPTTHDGFPMAQRGEAGRALSISATCTWLGGWIGCVIFVGLIQLAGTIIAAFKPPVYAAIIILALVVVGQSGSTRATKVIVSGGFGFMLSFVGSDPVSGEDRFTGGLSPLLNGLDIVPFALGVFAVTQIVIMYGTGKSVTGDSGQFRIENFGAQIRTGMRDTIRHPLDILRSATIAAGLGLIPGIGGFTANYVSYGVGQRVSRARKDFGTGVPEGIISAEGSSLAKEVGSLLPAVALGLPSGVGMVLFVAALSILGLQPGDPLVVGHASLPYSMMWAMAIAGFLSCFVGLLLAPQLSKITHIRGPLLLPFIGGLAVLGSFSSVTNSAGMIEMLFFAVIGVLARKCNYSVASMAVGLVLGATFDNNAFLTEQSYGWSFLWRSPLATAILAVAALIVIKRIADTYRRRGLPVDHTAASDMRTARAMEGPWALQMIVDGLFMAGSAWYFYLAIGYPESAGLIPGATAAVVAIVSAVRLVNDFRRRVMLRPGYVAGSRKWRAHGALAAAGAVSTRTEAAGRASVESRQDVSAGAGSVTAGSSAVPVTPARSDRRTANTETVHAPSRQPSSAPVAGGAGEPERSVRFGISWREAAAVMWAAAFVVSVLLFGFQIGLPITALVYCVFGLHLSRYRKAVFTVCTVVVLFALATVFMTVFHLTYSGLII